MAPIEEEFQYFIDHQDELVKQYNGKFIVIKNKEVIGAYDEELQAYQETIKDHKEGTFLIQECLPGEESYTQTFHSRVIF